MAAVAVAAGGGGRGGARSWRQSRPAWHVSLAQGARRVGVGHTEKVVGKQQPQQQQRQQQRRRRRPCGWNRRRSSGSVRRTGPGRGSGRQLQPPAAAAAAAGGRRGRGRGRGVSSSSRCSCCSSSSVCAWPGWTPHRHPPPHRRRRRWRRRVAPHQLMGMCWARRWGVGNGWGSGRGTRHRYGYLMRRRTGSVTEIPLRFCGLYRRCSHARGTRHRRGARQRRCWPRHRCADDEGWLAGWLAGCCHRRTILPSHLSVWCCMGAARDQQRHTPTIDWSTCSFDHAMNPR
jgi:hypothetical protein